LVTAINNHRFHTSASAAPCAVRWFSNRLSPAAAARHSGSVTAMSAPCAMPGTKRAAALPPSAVAIDAR